MMMVVMVMMVMMMAMMVMIMAIMVVAMPLQLYGSVVPNTVKNFNALLTGKNGPGVSYQGSEAYRVLDNLNIQVCFLIRLHKIIIVGCGCVGFNVLYIRLCSSRQHLTLVDRYNCRPLRSTRSWIHRRNSFNGLAQI